VSGFSIVFAKECIDNLRDKRTLFSSFSLALLGPILFVGIMVFVLERALGESDDPVEFSVIGAQYAPELMKFLENGNTEITNRDPVADPRSLVLNGDESLILIISPNYEERYTQGSPITLSAVFDGSDLSSTRRNLSQLHGLVNQYGRVIGLLRLQLRGIDPSIANPISVQDVDVASPAARALTILASLPYFLILVVFMGGFYLAIDTTAGEREHGSLEPLLTQPISRAQLVLGKVAATSLFGALSLLIFLVSLFLAIPFVPFDRIGMALEIGWIQNVTIFIIGLPLIFFAAALLTVVASFAKSYKEAQTYLTFVILVPTLPLIITQLMNVGPSLPLMFVPSLSQSTLMTDLIKGESVELLNVLISFSTTSVYAAMLTWVAVYLYRREQILG
jgi:sodium transport system permease protein